MRDPGDGGDKANQRAACPSDGYGGIPRYARDDTCVIPYALGKIRVNNPHRLLDGNCRRRVQYAEVRSGPNLRQFDWVGSPDSIATGLTTATSVPERPLLAVGARGEKLPIFFTPGFHPAPF